MSDDEKDNVVALPTRTKRPGLLPSRRKAGVCFHDHANVDDISRVIWCDDCGADLDPITELIKIARDGAWVVHMRKEKAALTREVEELQKERDALKSSVVGLKKRRGL